MGQIFELFLHCTYIGGQTLPGGIRTGAAPDEGIMPRLLQFTSVDQHFPDKR